MMMNFSELHLTDDGSVVQKDGTVVHFSPERFRNDIVEGDCCFLCGTTRHDIEFNDEHVIPDWILREFSLHDRLIDLPNGAQLRYGSYKVPCCCVCNSFLGTHVEQPVSDLLKGGHEAMGNYVRKETPWLLFKWLALIYLKTHLKDFTLRYSLDSRKSITTIGALYDWEAMHHIHCVVRTLRTGIKIDTRVIGSLFIFPVKEAEHLEGFDYGDLFGAKTLFLSFRDTAVVCVLNDACGCACLMRDGQLSKIAGPLSPIQLREVMARIAYMNTLIKTRPKFFTTAGVGAPEISVQLPDYFESDKGIDEEYGAMMWHACRNLMDGYAGDDREVILDNIRGGQWTFLFNSDGSFASDSMDILRPRTAQQPGRGDANDRASHP